MDVLALNIGSSSLKWALYPVLPGGEVAAARVSGLVEGLQPGGQLAGYLQTAQGRTAWAWPGAAAGPSPAEAREAAGQRLAQVLAGLRPLLQPHLPDGRLAAVAHRIVHGGAQFTGPVRLQAAELQALDALSPLAPLHQPHNLAGVRACLQAFAGVPQIGCFDTAFHQSLLPLEARFALPQALHAQGIRRYGFHGLSYDYVAGCLARRSARAHGRVLMAHLGNGASLCAMTQGRSVATTMGFSALDGLVMGTRSGALDPGVLLYLLQQGWDEPRLSRLLYSESGLLGVSGLSADMRQLRASGQPQAQLAIDLFVHRVVREGGALMTVLEGVDALALTGGIGEHDAATRAAIVRGWRVWGLQIDEAANAAADGSTMVRIDAPGSSAEVWVVPTDEGRVAARQAAQLLGSFSL